MKQIFEFFNFVMTATNFQSYAFFTMAWGCFVALTTTFIDHEAPSFEGGTKQVADAVTPANCPILNNGIA